MDWNSQLLLLLQVLLATVLGAVIGLQREWDGHEAGVRTHAAVSLGSALFGMLAFAHGSGDVHRIAAQVASGIGFLGAGVILHTPNRVKGLTTAATLWATSSIGLSVAYQLYLLAILCTMLMVGLLLLNHLEWWTRFTRPRKPKREKLPPPPVSADEERA
jgi:putative Mg2+ transporter-C (MgtC) family protein